MEKTKYLYVHTQYTQFMKCYNCKRAYGYMRIKTEEWVCRFCGRISILSIKQKTKNFMGLNVDP